MTRAKLIARIVASHPQFAQKKVEVSVRTILDALAQNMAQGQRIEIRGFGTFGLTYRPARPGRNPKSGQQLQVPAKFVPRFRAAKELRTRVDPMREVLPRL